MVCNRHRNPAVSQLKKLFHMVFYIKSSSTVSSTHHPLKEILYHNYPAMYQFDHILLLGRISRISSRRLGFCASLPLGQNRWASAKHPGWSTGVSILPGRKHGNTFGVFTYDVFAAKRCFLNGFPFKKMKIDELIFQNNQNITTCKDVLHAGAFIHVYHQK